MSNYSDSENKIDELQFSLSQLVDYLVRNYPDDQWDSETRLLIDDAFAALGRPKVDWDLI